MEKILIVDDEDNIRFILSELLEKAGYQTIQAENGNQALVEFENFYPELVLLDYKLPDMNGNQILDKMKEINSSVIVIMLTAFGDIKKAVESMKLGAFDYLTKPFNNEEILLVVQKALKTLELTQEIKTLRKRIEGDIEIKEMMGESSQIRKVLEQVELVASNDITVFLEGETGTGKDLIAKMIHKKSPRKDKSFVAVDCGAVPETLFESELFGYEKGAFTGAVSRRIGKFEQANGGTLFLDEITNLPMSLQPKLLRVIQDNEIQRLGGGNAIKINVRIIVASNKNIIEDVRNGKFRDDLFYRIHEFKIDLPTLKERKDDIPILANYFLKEANYELKKNIEGFSTQAMNSLLDYTWPGNIRELKNVIKRAVIITKSKTILPDHLLFTNLKETIQENEIDEDLLMSSISGKVIESKIQIIKKAILKADGNKTKAAEILGISRNQLYRILHKAKE
ncbi:MAG: sigma-54-dependent Fis family transcriptional regulator [Candidatus Cloacimonetes bacterium]|nr:sigma-54-dependent Fis family transcriptional regulator [Candidatus Cloacimonadota bacterium]